jgi:FtsX-like permease family protein
MIMQTSNAKIGWSLWLQWVLASVLGFSIGTTIGNAFANLIPAMTCTQSFSDSFIDRLTNFPCIQPSLGLILIVFILGLAGGFMQWLVLRRRIAGTGWWIPATALGFPIALVLADRAMRLAGEFAAAPILLGVLFGVLSGSLPWLVLRRQNAGAGWWLPAHLLGALVGGAFGIVAFHAVALMGLYQFTWAAAGAMFGAGLGAITGIALVWLLRKSISES